MQTKKLLTFAAACGLLSTTAVAQQAVGTAEKDSVAFDPGQMAEAKLDTPPLGLRYANLSQRQVSVLRKRVSLPLDSLLTATGPTDLASSIVVAPLPNPNRPLLKTSDNPSASSNPFGVRSLVSFREDPLKALGDMLRATSGESSESSLADGSVDSDLDDPFGAGGSDFGSDTPISSSQPEIDEADTADPFAEAADPFGDPGADSDDPFGGF